MSHLFSYDSDNLNSGLERIKAMMVTMDFHSHVLPGIDDGSRDVEMSLEMLRMAAGQGVDIMVATPHFYASRRSVEEFLERRNDAYERLKEHLTDDLPKLKLGAEVAFFPGISKAEKVGSLTIEGTNILLLEMPFSPWTDAQMQEVKDLVRGGEYHLMLAHLERYLMIPENRRKIEELQKLPLHVQINAESFLEWKKRRALAKMIDKSREYLLGSDCHGVNHRPPNLAEGRAMIEKKFGADFLRRIDEAGSVLLAMGGEKDV